MGVSERGPFSVILQCEFCKFKFAGLEVWKWVGVQTALAHPQDLHILLCHSPLP